MACICICIDMLGQDYELYGDVGQIGFGVNYWVNYFVDKYYYGYFNTFIEKDFSLPKQCQPNVNGLFRRQTLTLPILRNGASFYTYPIILL